MSIFLRALRLITIVIWVGGLIFFAFVLAPLAFHTLPSNHEAGLIVVRQTERDQQYPERTVYELTEDGRRELLAWLADMLATPRNEFPQFPAALSFAMLLDPGQALAVLERRAAALRENLTRLEHDLTAFSGSLPRVTLLDDEYLRAVTAAELNWVSGVLDDLRTGVMTWSEEELAGLANEELTDLAVSFLPE